MVEVKVFCKDCRYIEWIPVDGPTMSEARCRKIKEYLPYNDPIGNARVKVLYCNPWSDNITNECSFFEERKSLLDKIFSWSW